jgi:hypothetical protein
MYHHVKKLMFTVRRDGVARLALSWRPVVARGAFRI